MVITEIYTYMNSKIEGGGKLSYDNVKLWFAKNVTDDIVTIDEINKENKNDTYLCPMCGSKLIPKAIKSKQITSHFAHVDVSKCNSETMIHWWFKHKFLEKGDTFTVVSDKERKYVCKDVLTEKHYNVDDKVYKPDVTVVTECGNIIYFEMAFSNKKKVQDYIDIWLELKNIVVEVDIKQLMLRDTIPIFKALFYDGKCFNTKKNDTYYNTIGKYKEEKFQGEVDRELKERIRKLDWFWDDVLRYKKGERDIKYMIDLIDYIDEKEKHIVKEILNKKKCNDVFQVYVEKRFNYVYESVVSLAKKYFNEEYNNYIEIYDESTNKRNSEKEICVVDSTNNCLVSVNILDNNFIKDCIDIFENNLKYNEKMELKTLWENKRKEKIAEIKSNRELINFMDELKNKDYRLELWFDYKNIEGFLLNIILYYKNTSAKRYEIKADDWNNIDEVVMIIKQNINKYFSELDKLDNVDKLNELTKLLGLQYSNIVEVEGKILLEDSFRINIFNYDNFYINESYYISNGKIMHDYEINEEIIVLNNINFIKDYITKDFNNKLKHKLKNRCIECKNKFTLSIGEVKFYNSKGLNFPRRCKCCRDKRK